MAKRKSTKKSSRKSWSMEKLFKRYFVLFSVLFLGLGGYYFINSNSESRVLGDTITTAITPQPCVKRTPSLLLINPTVKSQGRGGEVKYSVFVGNNDAKGCTSRNLILDKVLPAITWMGTFDKSSFTIEPGNNYIQVFKVKSASWSKNGVYKIKIKIRGTDAEKSAYYVVITPTPPPTPAPTGVPSKPWFIF